ncbi:MAG: EAL domain-containing protein, partial [Gammaproteobacteria bacterium]|nr:EAL domain-containing protein [Gammaproteobacteria bacterium]
MTAALIPAIAFGAHLAGYLARFEHAIAEARAVLLRHEAPSDIVIIGIDSHSLRELSEWPWPRRHFARLLQQLDAAEPSGARAARDRPERTGPKSVFIDVDFSSHTTPDDDQLLENALAEWSGPPVLLATHFQLRDGAPDPDFLTQPLPRFARHAGEVAVTLEQSPDGLVRAMRSSWLSRGREIPSIFAVDEALPPSTPIPIDFSISPSSFGFAPFSDVLNGRIDPAAFAGKRIYVGATAVELRDVVAVPVYRTLPGVVVQALATETVRAGPLRSLPGWLLLGILAAVAAAAQLVAERSTWRRNVLWLAGGLVLLFGASLYLYDVRRIDLPSVPFALVFVGAFTATTLRSLDRQTWRAVAFALRLKRRDALLRSIVDSSADAIISIDGGGTVRAANPAASRLLELPLYALTGANLGRFLPPLGADDALDVLDGRVTDCAAVTATGNELPVEITVSRVTVDDDVLYTVIVRDVSERVAQQRLLDHQARHDRLTGLPNRTALYEYLQSVLQENAPADRAALLLLDLTRFTDVNDTLGHDVGDEVLSVAGGRLTEALGRQAFVARIGGDEFAVVLAGIDTRDIVDAVALALIDSLKPPIHARGVAIDVGANIGIAVSPDHARGAQELLRRADVAMYAAKRSGSWFEYYEEEHDNHTVRRLRMVGELRAALEDETLMLHYQPQVNLRTGRAESVEALVRWQHPILGDVPPDEFIGLAESTQLIRPLTEWTIRRALSDVASWEAEGLSVRVAVNLSARMLQSEDFAEHLSRMLDAQGVKPDRLELEITETAMMDDPARALQVVHELGRLGITVSIDDFGTGFSSLGYLRDLRVHALKLDKSFVTDVEEREQNRVIVESTVQMAHALGLKIVAEGIETPWVDNYLTEIGYDFGQGYCYSRPLPSAECLAWVVRFNAAE